jgi:hypothetical protein
VRLFAPDWASWYERAWFEGGDVIFYVRYALIFVFLRFPQVNGEFKCLGSQQHLKNRFGKGFSIMAKVDPQQDTTELKDFLLGKFPGMILKDEHYVGGRIALRLLFFLRMSDSPSAKIIV